MIEFLSITLGAVVCLAGILGGTALIMSVSERAYMRHLAKAGIVAPSVAKSSLLHREAAWEREIALCLDAISKLAEYQGKFVAVTNGPQTTAIASADTYSALLNQVKETKGTFSVIFMPKEGVIYSP